MSCCCLRMFQYQRSCLLRRRFAPRSAHMSRRSLHGVVRGGRCLTHILAGNIRFASSGPHKSACSSGYLGGRSTKIPYRTSHNHSAVMPGHIWVSSATPRMGESCSRHDRFVRTQSSHCSCSSPVPDTVTRGNEHQYENTYHRMCSYLATVL